MSETEIQRRKSNGSVGAWIRGVATTAMLALLGWGGKTLWEVNGTLNKVNEKITGVERTVSEKITSVEVIVTHQAKMSRKAEEAQWRLIQEHTNDIGRLKAQIETLRYVQKEIVLPELQTPVPRRIILQFSNAKETRTAGAKPRKPPKDMRERILRWWAGGEEVAQAQAQRRVDFKELEQKLKQIERSKVYGRGSGARKSLKDFTRDQIEQRQPQRAQEK